MSFNKKHLPTYIFLFITLYACSGIEEKPKDAKPETEYKGLDEIRKTHREIDSIKSIQKKKLKRLDTLKPSVAIIAH